MIPFGVGDLVAGKTKRHKDRRGFIIRIDLVQNKRRFTIRWEDNVESVTTIRGIDLLLNAAEVATQGVNPLIVQPPNPPHPPEEPLGYESESSDSDSEQEEGIIEG